MNDYHQVIADAVTDHSKRHAGRLVDYIEVGVLTGNSALAVLSTHKCRYAVLIDNFSNTHCGDTKSSRAIVEKNLNDYKGVFEIIEGDSNDVLPSLSADNFDIGFVDGNHEAEACWMDMTNMLPLLREDGVMFVDDVENPGYHLKDLVPRFAHGNKLTCKIHRVHNVLAELTRK